MLSLTIIRIMTILIAVMLVELTHSSISLSSPETQPSVWSSVLGSALHEGGSAALKEIRPNTALDEQPFVYPFSSIILKAFSE